MNDDLLHGPALDEAWAIAKSLLPADLKVCLDCLCRRVEAISSPAAAVSAETAFMVRERIERNGIAQPCTEEVLEIERQIAIETAFTQGMALGAVITKQRLG